MSSSRERTEVDGIGLIGCCGAFCGTCRPLMLGSCMGCKLGYGDGNRSIARARCHVKRCCIGIRRHETCADCRDHRECEILARFFGKDEQDRKKHRERHRKALEFIRINGYSEFLRKAAAWKRHYGEL